MSKSLGAAEYASPSRERHKRLAKTNHKVLSQEEVSEVLPKRTRKVPESKDDSVTMTKKAITKDKASQKTNVLAESQPESNIQIRRSERNKGSDFSRQSVAPEGNKAKAKKTISKPVISNNEAAKTDDTEKDSYSELLDLIQQKNDVATDLFQNTIDTYLYEGNYLEETKHRGNAIRGYRSRPSQLLSPSAYRQVKINENDRIFTHSSLASETVLSIRVTKVTPGSQSSDQSVLPESPYLTEVAGPSTLYESDSEEDEGIPSPDGSDSIEVVTLSDESDSVEGVEAPLSDASDYTGEVECPSPDGSNSVEVVETLTSDGSYSDEGVEAPLSDFSDYEGEVESPSSDGSDSDEVVAALTSDDEVEAPLSDRSDYEGEVECPSPDGSDSAEVVESLTSDGSLEGVECPSPSRYNCVCFVEGVHFPGIPEFVDIVEGEPLPEGYKIVELESHFPDGSETVKYVAMKLVGFPHLDRYADVEVIPGRTSDVEVVSGRTSDVPPVVSPSPSSSVEFGGRTSRFNVS